MRIYYDTEFIDDGISIEFLSIGLIRDDGVTYYAVTDDETAIKRAAKNPWLYNNIVRKLPYMEINGDWYPDPEHKDYWHIQSRGMVTTRLKALITKTLDVQLWAWYAAYDHVVLAQLFGRMIDLPEGVPMFTMDLKQEHVRLGSPRLPEQAEGEHNALEDAKWNKIIGDHMKGLSAWQ